MLRTFTFLSVAILLLTAGCKKGELVAEQSYGLLELELVNLPGTSPLEVYMENTLLKDSLVPPSIRAFKTQLVAAGKSTKVTFRKRGSNEILLDTSVTVAGGEKMNLRLAFSEDLGIKAFLKGKPSFGTDSSAFQLFNQLPLDIQDDAVKVEAVLYMVNPNTGEFDELEVFENFTRSKLHPKSVTLPLMKDGSNITYLLKYRNMDTGEFLFDTVGNDLLELLLAPGKEQIIIATTDSIDLGGFFMHFFTMQPIEL